MTKTIPIGIIGDGYSAAALTYHAMICGIPREDMMIFGEGQLGHGRAYGTMHDDYRLNVRADLMQLNPSSPNDFSDWAKVHIHDPDAVTDVGIFYRRRDYACYLTARLNPAAQSTTQSTPHHPIPQCPIQVTAITPSKNGWLVCSEQGHIATCRQLILATGNPPTTPPFALPPTLSNMVHKAPWLGTGFDQIAPGDRIAIIGGGLTALDIVSALYSSEDWGDEGGHITLITTGGHLPPPQLNWDAERAHDASSAAWPHVSTASQFAHTFLSQLDHNVLDDVAEQEKFEHLRHDFNTNWAALPLKDRQRLMARLGWCWQKIRYRSTPQSATAIHGLKAQGRFTLHSGRVTAITDNHGTLCLTLDNASPITADRVILATGRGHDPFIEKLMDDGLVTRPFQTDAQHRVLSPHDTGSLFSLGPPTIISQGDVIGVSAIARMAKDLAMFLAAA